MSYAKNKSTKVKRQKEVYFTSVRLENEIFALADSGKLTPEELEKWKTYKEKYQLIQKLGERVAKAANLTFEFGKYYKFRSELLKKYNQPTTIQK